MRTITAAQQAILAASGQTEHVRVSVKDSGGTFRDLTTYPGFNAVKSVQWADSVDASHMTADITLVRESHKLSLAPLMTNSALNRGFNPAASYAALIALNREVRIEVAVTPLGKSPAGGDWMEVFRGRIDDYDQAAGGGELKISCRDLGGRLAQQYIKTELVYAYAQDGAAYVPLRVWEPQIPVVLNQTYCLPASRGATDPGGNKFFKCSQSGTTGTSEPTWTTGTNIADGTAKWNYVGAPSAGGVPVQNVMQNILDDHKASGDSSVTLYTPTSPGWAIKQFIQKREFVLSAIATLAKQIGWEVKYKWRAATSQFELTFSQPQRTSPSVAYTFGPSDYEEPTRLGTSIAEIRNAWRIVYSDSADLWPDGQPKRKTLEVSDATSIAKYGELWAEMQEDTASNIDTVTEATALVNAALSDCKEPTAELAVALTRGFPWVEANDYYTFSPDGRYFDNPQSLAVTGWTQTYEGGHLRTELTLRGQPSLGALMWIAATVHPSIPVLSVPPPVQHFNGRETPLVSLSPEVGGVFGRVVDTIDRRHLDQEVEVHLYTAPGTPITSATLKTVLRGRDFSVGDLTPGATYYMRSVPRWQDKNGRMVRGQPSPEQSFVAGRASTAHLEDLAVTTAKLGNLSVSTGKLADLSVSTGKIIDGAVLASKIPNREISGIKIAVGAVTSGELGDGAVTSAKILDGAVLTSKIGASAVVPSKLDAGPPIMIWDDARGYLLDPRILAVNQGSKAAVEALKLFVTLNVTSGATDFYFTTDLQCHSSRGNTALLTYRCNGSGWKSGDTLCVYNVANLSESATAVMIADGAWHTASFDLSSFVTTGTLRVDVQDSGVAIGSGATFDIAYIGFGALGGGGSAGAMAFKRGNVGFGTSAPRQRLEISGPAANTGTAGFDMGQVIICDEETNTSGLVVGYRWQSGVTEYALAQALNGLGPVNLLLQPGGGNVGIGSSTPYAGPRLYIEGLDRWNPWASQVYGDVYIGNASYGIKMGIALGGGGAGAATLAAQGGTNSLSIGAGATQAHQQAINITNGVTTIVPTPVAALSFGSGWRDYVDSFGGSWSRVRYWKDPFGVVHIQGLATRFSGTGTTIGTLPTGFRPPAQIIFTVDCNSGFGRIDIDTSGNIVLTVGTPTNYVSLSGVTFSTHG